jgi:hypothetical protein
MSYVQMSLEMRMRKRMGAFVDEVFGAVRMAGVYILCN